MSKLTPDQVAAAVAAAKARIAEKAAKTLQLTSIVEAIKKNSEATVMIPALATGQYASTGGINWNHEQQLAISWGCEGKSFNLIGAAGTGKTTTLRGLLTTLLSRNLVPPLEAGTQYLSSGSPGIALVSYTRRAVRNIAKQMPDELRSHCLTIHKLLEFAPEYYEEQDELTRAWVKKMRFAPTKNNFSPLPRNLKTIVIDESSMVSIELFELLLDALPDPSAVQFIFLGDLNQLPPVYGQAILGLKLLELPIVELTQVYRQALESPIISLALAIKENNFSGFIADSKQFWKVRQWDDKTTKWLDVEGGTDPKKFNARVRVEKEGRGIVTFHPWKKQLDQEDALMMMQKQLRVWIDQGIYNPDEDLVLCPWNKSFGTDELNKTIADHLGKKRGAVVHEIIAGFEKHYWAIGDKVLVDKQECIVLDIFRNTKYIGVEPSPASAKLDRWGVHHEAVKMMDHADISEMEIDDLLETLSGDVADRKNQASHTVKLKFLDSDGELLINTAAAFNTASFGYAITVHKAQGSECRRVFFLTHYCHAAMCFRELVYTAITRAAEELYILMPPSMLYAAAQKPRIKGNTLQAKLDFFTERFKERLE